MYSHSGIFYAYARHINNDWNCQYLITFASCDVADSWWRAVTDSVINGYQRFAAVKRVSPQFFIHDHGKGDIQHTITDPSCAIQFIGQVFFTLINDEEGHSVIPVLNYTEKISGNKYFIRSSIRPDYFWYFDGNLARASNTCRSKFSISICGATKGTTMIGSDQIVIGSRGMTSMGITGPLSALGTSTNHTIFKFSDFDANFEVTEDGIITMSPSEGEGWELL